MLTGADGRLTAERSCALRIFRNAAPRSRFEGLMKPTPSEDLIFIAVESGAHWPLSRRAVPGTDVDTVVTNQLATETAGQFAARIITTLMGLSAEGRKLRLAILASNGGSGADERGARYRISRALLSTMCREGSGELILMADDHCPDGARHELFARAGARCDELGGTDVGVRVRFSELGSGVRRIAVDEELDEEPDAATGS